MQQNGADGDSNVCERAASAGSRHDGNADRLSLVHSGREILIGIDRVHRTAGDSKYLKLTGVGGVRPVTRGSSRREQCPAYGRYTSAVLNGGTIQDGQSYFRSVRNRSTPVGLKQPAEVHLCPMIAGVGRKV